jgi:hypothetical protein
VDSGALALAIARNRFREVIDDNDRDFEAIRYMKISGISILGDERFKE